jgi:hypothetical protein
VKLGAGNQQVLDSVDDAVKLVSALLEVWCSGALVLWCSAVY